MEHPASKQCSLLEDAALCPIWVYTVFLFPFYVSRQIWVKSYHDLGFYMILSSAFVCIFLFTCVDN